MRSVPTAFLVFFAALLVACPSSAWSADSTTPVPAAKENTEKKAKDPDPAYTAATKNLTAEQVKNLAALDDMNVDIANHVLRRTMMRIGLDYCLENNPDMSMLKEIYAYKFDDYVANLRNEEKRLQEQLTKKSASEASFINQKVLAAHQKMVLDSRVYFGAKMLKITLKENTKSVHCDEIKKTLDSVSASKKQGEK